MKIMGNNSFINLDAYSKNVDEKKKVDIPNKIEEKATSKEDKVELSSSANKIREARKCIESIPDIREQKIAHIETQIRNGAYQIKEMKVASMMLRESLLNELL